MQVLDIGLKQTPDRRSVIGIVVDVPPGELAELVRRIQSQPHTVEFTPVERNATRDQINCIWAKITEIADAIYSSKPEVYEIILRRYGQGQVFRRKADSNDNKGFRTVEEIGLDDDGLMVCIGYKGLSQMTSSEASRVLEGCLDELKQMGLPGVM